MLILVEATYGSGKTLFTTNAALHSDVPVYANYEMAIPQYNPLVLSEVMENDSPGLIIIDEAHMYINSRMSGQPVNIFLSQILFQSRKIGKDFLLTEQLNRTIDINFREMADFRVACQRLDGEGRGVLRPDMNDPAGFNDSFQYALFAKSGELIGVWEMSYDYAKENIFPIYNTKKLISTTRDISKEMLLIDPEDTEKGVNDLLDIIGNELPGVPYKAWTKGVIADIVYKNRYPKAYVDKVYARVKMLVLKETYKS